MQGLGTSWLVTCGWPLCDRFQKYCESRTFVLLGTENVRPGELHGAVAHALDGAITKLEGAGCADFFHHVPVLEVARPGSIEPDQVLDRQRAAGNVDSPAALVELP